MGDDDGAMDCIDCNTMLSLDDGGEWPSIGPICYGCLDDRRERLAADVAALKAEVERLTPREMTNAEVCEVLNKHRYLADRRVGYDLTWKIDVRGRFANGTLDGNGYASHAADVLLDWEARYIAQGLLRDAGPTAEREPARGEERGG
jgi:hypothetical protein